MLFTKEVNPVILAIEDGRKLITSEEVIKSWLKYRTNLHTDGKYLYEETEERQTIYNEEAIKDVINILSDNTPAAKVLRTIVNECAQADYNGYPTNGMWEEKLKYIATKGVGYIRFPELVSYKRVKKITKAEIIKL